jgi:PhnB protein
MLMVGQAMEGWPSRPQTLYLYVEDADTLFARAVVAGASILRPIEDMYYGDRCGGLVDGEGNQWWIATRKEDLSDEEQQHRAAASRK